MKLHGNAPFGPKGRATMVRRVTEEEWSLTEAAEAAGVSERTARKWVDRYRAEGEAGLCGPQLGAARGPRPHPRGPRRGDRRPAAGADDRRRDRRVPGDGALHGLGRARPDRPRQAQPPGAPRAAQPLRAQAPRRADPHRRQEAGADRNAAPGTGCTGKRTTHAGGAGWEFVHVCVDDATRLAYVEVLGDEKATTAIGFLRRALAFYARPRDRRSSRLMTDNGSAYRSIAHALACRALGHPPHPHPPLPAAHQRQGRALHPHDARRLGLRGDLPRLAPAHRGAIRLAGLL